MLIKQCQFAGRDEHGEYLHVLEPQRYNDHIEKVAVASPPQIDTLRQFAYENLPKDPDKLYALISAMGASEYWGSNSNADWFSEEALIHKPPNWDSLSYPQQRISGANWEWGFPTFYNAKAFQHHKNKDPNRAFGDVVYVLWDDFMKRVLLIVAFSRAKADAEGALRVVQRIEDGDFPAVSMGARLLWDLCSVCGDWPRILGLGGNPQRVLAEHRRRPIRGVATTPAAYCEHLKLQRNHILPDGRVVVMHNTHPRFFDISAVFIGADKTSFVLTKLAGECPIRPGHRRCGSCSTTCFPHAAHVHEVWESIRA